MRFIIEKFVKEWAEIYKPMLHDDRKNPRFFIAEDDYKLAQSFINTKPEKSPIVVVTSDLSGRITDRFDYPVYSVYMFSQCDLMHDGDDTMEAKREAKASMIALLNLVRAFKDGDMVQLERLPFKEGGYLDGLRDEVAAGKGVLKKIEIEDVVYRSVSTLVDGWCGVYVTLEDIEPYDMCVDEGDYV